MRRYMKTLFAMPLLAAVICASAVPALAAAPQLYGDVLVDGILSTVLYSAIGMFMAFIGFKVIDLLTPGHLGKSIADNNVASGVLAGLTMLGICIIIAAVIAS